jgi:hypothetical protein
MINYNMDEIRTMVYKLGQCACDASNLVSWVTGVVTKDFEFAVVYEDKCCAIAVAYNIDEDEKNQAVAAQIKGPIQCNGTNNPVLMIEADGTVVRHHSETGALVKHLRDLCKAIEGKLY